MPVDFEVLKIREYIWNLLKNVPNNQWVIESISCWARQYSDIIGTSLALDLDNEESLEQTRRLIMKSVSPMGSDRNAALSNTEELVKTLCTLFHLSPVEQDVLGLLVRTPIQESLKDIMEQILVNRRCLRFGQLNLADAIAKMTGRTPTEVANALESQGKLCISGLIEIANYNITFEIPEKIKYLFVIGDQLNTRTELKRYLTGPKQTASLAWEDFAHLGKDRELLERLLSAAIDSRSKGINILLYGKPGVGKTEFCRVLADHLGVSLYAAVDMERSGDKKNRSSVTRGLRLMQGILAADPRSFIMFDDTEDVFGAKRTESESALSKAAINRQLEENQRPVFWLTCDAEAMDRSFLSRMTYCLEFGELPFSVRVTMAQNECEKRQLSVSPDDLQKFIREYDLPPAVFANAVNAATLAGGGFAEVRHVVAGSEKLLGVARNNSKTPSQFNLALINADIDLPQITTAILRGERRDFSFCLSGPPGTGKSEFARWFAGQLNMEVLFKRASDLVSKWLGVTEQNIAGAFREAEARSRMLIFDEADSFLRSRREAQRSWEVSHVNEMLTWMERHPMPFICTTNLSEILDEAAFRRFTFKIRFDYLKREQIATAFYQFFGQAAPLEVLALDFLTPGDFAVVKKKVNYYGSASGEEIGQMLVQETLVKQGRVNTRQIGFKVG